MGTDATRQLADFGASLTIDDVPRDVKQNVQRHLLDSMGCAVFSTRVPPASQIAKLVGGMGVGSCTIAGTSLRTTPTDAALANGTLVHGFELDDVGAYVHPSACVVPAAMAITDYLRGERVVSGRELLVALAAGYEGTVRLAECVGPVAELEIGWYPPPFHGAVGGAVTAGKLLEFDRDEMRQAIAIACHIAGGGLMCVRGTDIKRMHAGRGAESGVMAALLAREGLRGVEDVIEHEPWGYCYALDYTREGPHYDLEKITDDLGQRFVAFDRLGLKYYSVGAEQISVIDNVKSLKEAHDLTATDVERVEIGMTQFHYDNKKHEFPNSLSEVNFNAGYVAALALLYPLEPVYRSGQTVNRFLEGYRDERVFDLYQKTEEHVDEELQQANPYSVDSRITIHLQDGAVIEQESEYVRDAESEATMRFQPMDDEQVKAKFFNLATDVIARPRLEQVYQAISSLSDVDDVGGVFDKLSLEDETHSSSRHN